MSSRAESSDHRRLQTPSSSAHRYEHEHASRSTPKRHKSDKDKSAKAKHKKKKHKKKKHKAKRSHPDSTSPSASQEEYASKAAKVSSSRRFHSRSPSRHSRTRSPSPRAREYSTKPHDNHRRDSDRSTKPHGSHRRDSDSGRDRDARRSRSLSPIRNSTLKQPQLPISPRVYGPERPPVNSHQPASTNGSYNNGHSNGTVSSTTRPPSVPSKRPIFHAPKPKAPRRIKPSRTLISVPTQVR
jgi:hypothetical protein